MGDYCNGKQMVMRFADRELLASLVALLPPDVVTIRASGGVPCPYVRSLAAALIEHALCHGHEIDRTNSDGPLDEWDGWLKIEVPGNPLLLKIAKPGGGKLA